MNIIIHSKEAFQKMRNAGKLAAQLLQELGQLVKPGITTAMLDEYAKNFIEKHKIKSACLGYMGHNAIPFPGYICTSVNHVICHGIPSSQILKDGDIISIDLTIILNEYHADTCATFCVGNISTANQQLLDATKKALEIGIATALPGLRVGDIGNAIQNFIKTTKFSIVEDYCGHGIGTIFHTNPEVPHYGRSNTGALIQEGMFFTIEPMINAGAKHTRLLQDGWSVITKDFSISAQFEHTLGITEHGPEIFTTLM